MDETAMILRIQKGDMNALDPLIRHHASSLYRYCCYLCENSDGAAELFQDTWERAILKIHKCDPNRPILGWLITIAANINRDNGRRKQRWNKILTENSLAPISQTTAMEKLEEDEEHRIVRMAVNQLPDKYRVPLIMCYFEEMNAENIARLLNIPSGTVKSRIHRGKKFLRTKLEVLL